MKSEIKQRRQFTTFLSEPVYHLMKQHCEKYGLKITTFIESCIITSIDEADYQKENNQ
jgi:hypothetical protein